MADDDVAVAAVDGVREFTDEGVVDVATFKDVGPFMRALLSVPAPLLLFPFLLGMPACSGVLAAETLEDGRAQQRKNETIPMF